MLFTALTLNACSVKVKDAGDHGSIYSREYTKYISSDANFGSGRGDDIYVALRYIYENSDLNKKYGDSFEVSDMGGSSDCQAIIFNSFFKGTGKYFIDINNDEWTVELSKSYWGKWEVTSCYPRGDNQT